MKLIHFIAVLIAVATSSPAVAADAQAQQAFESVFGARLKQVKTTRAADDDLALAKEMVTVAAESQPSALGALLLDQAYELAIRIPDGSFVAADALTVLAERYTERRNDAREKLAVLWTRQLNRGTDAQKQEASSSLLSLYSAMAESAAERKQYGEASALLRKALIVASKTAPDQVATIRTSMESYTRLDRIEGRKATLEQRVLANRNDHVSAEALVKLLLVEFDDPASVVQYHSAIKDERLKKIAQAAAAEDAGEADLLMLGDWYREAAISGSDAEAAMLRRASNAYDKYLEAHTAADTSRSVVELHKRSIATRLDKLGAPPPLKPVGTTTAGRFDWEKMKTKCSYEYAKKNYSTASYAPYIDDKSTRLFDGELTEKKGMVGWQGAHPSPIIFTFEEVVKPRMIRINFKGTDWFGECRVPIVTVFTQATGDNRKPLAEFRPQTQESGWIDIPLKGTSREWVVEFDKGYPWVVIAEVEFR